MCKFSAFFLLFDERVLRGFQKGMTLGIRPSGNACKVAGGVGWGGGPFNYSVTSSPVFDFGFWTLDFGLWILDFGFLTLDLDFDWTFA